MITCDLRYVELSVAIQKSFMDREWVVALSKNWIGVSAGCGGEVSFGGVRTAPVKCAK